MNKWSTERHSIHHQSVIYESSKRKLGYGTTRFGLEHVLLVEHNNDNDNSTANTSTNKSTNTQVDELVITELDWKELSLSLSENGNDSDPLDKLTKDLQGCPYQAIVSAYIGTFESVLLATQLACPDNNNNKINYNNKKGEHGVAWYKFGGAWLPWEIWILPCRSNIGCKGPW
jgi:hypothetical protein